MMNQNQKRSNLSGWMTGVAMLALWVSIGTMTSCGSEDSDPVAEPVPSFTTAVDELTVNFTNTSTDANLYEWDFGVTTSADDVSTDENPTFTYPEDGTYTVTLRATGDGGTKATTMDVTVAETVIPGEPVAAYTLVTQDSTIILTNTSTDATTFAWDFGVPDIDTDVSTEKDPTFTYPAEGRYLLTLTVTGEGGTDVKTDSVFVGEFGFKNGTWDEYENKDDNRIPWRNEDLERDADDAIANSDYFAKASSGQNHTPDGSYSGNLTSLNTSSKPQRWMYQPLYVSPNTDYTITFWIWAASGNKVETTAQIYSGRFSTVAGIDVPENIIAEAVFGDEASKDDWVEVSFSFNSGDHTEVVFYMDNDFTNATEQSWYDDFVITED
ncbi:MAG: PKD domain-containing protein [Cyclobacteriaceae bacterium]